MVKDRNENPSRAGRNFGGPEQIIPGELHYYSRSEPPRPEEQRGRNKGRGGVFRNNPSLLIILIDIIVVVLVLVFLLPFIRPGSSEDDFKGYSFSLHGYVHEGKAYTSIIVQSAGVRESVDRPEQKKTDTFVIQVRVLDTDREDTFYFKPGETAENTLVYRSSFAIPADNDENSVRVRCTVVLGDKALTLEKKLSE